MLNSDNQQKLNDSLSSLLDWAKSAGDFVAGQVPLVAQEIIHFGIASYAFFCVLAVVGIVYGLWALPKVAKQTDPYIELLLETSGLASVMFGVVALLRCGYMLLMVTFAPRLYLIEYLSNLVK